MDVLLLLLLQIQYENTIVATVQNACKIRDKYDKEDMLLEIAKKMKKNKNLDFH